MNNCVSTLTNIINNKSMAVLEHESDQLINNLGLEQIVGIPEIADFRTDLMAIIGNLKITEQERELLRRVNSMQRDNLKWKALSGALNNTMLITGGGNNAYQMGFQILVTAARTGIEYKASKNEQEIAELQAMWELRKGELEEFNKLRKEAFRILYNLYKKYNLKESDRLTEKTAIQFNKIVSNPDAKTMVRLLNDNFGVFGHMADYYYYLGMGNLDCGNLKKAEECFDKYSKLYNKAPLFRINEKAGMIALARLGYSANMSKDNIEKNINVVVTNLPNNSMAIIQCALLTDKVLNNPTKALSIIRKALDNESSDDKTALIHTASLILPKVNNKSAIYQDFLAAYINQTHYDLDAEINIWIAKKENVFSKLSQIFAIENLVSSHLIANSELNNKIIFIFPSKYTVDLNKVRMYVEKHDKDEVLITPYYLREKNALTLEKIEKITAFKDNKNLKYLFMDALDDNRYIVKQNLDFNAITTGDFPGLDKFELSTEAAAADRKKIVKFLKENAPENSKNEIIATKSEKDLVEKIKNKVTNYFNNGIGMQIYHVLTQSGNTYIKFLLDDIRKIEICYKFDPKKECLIPAYIKAQRKITFANNAMMKEFGYAPATTKTTEETSKQKSTNETPQKPKQETKSWWKFWDDNKETTNKSPKSVPVKKEEKKATNQEKSWWKFWDDNDKKSESKSAPQQKTVTTKSQKKTVKTNPAKDVKEKSWWEKLTGSNEKADQKEAVKSSPSKNKEETQSNKQTASKKNVNKKSENKKSDNEKPWWKVWD